MGLQLMAQENFALGNLRLCARQEGSGICDSGTLKQWPSPAAPAKEVITPWREKDLTF